MDRTNMNLNNTGNPVHNEAALRLQEKRNEVAKAMRWPIIGAFFLIIPPIGLGLIFIGYFKLVKAQRGMEELYKDAFVKEPLLNNFENVIYEPEGGLPYQTVKNTSLFKMGNRYSSEDYIRAVYAGVDFEVAQIKVMYVDNSDDGHGSETYFDGRIMTFDFPDKLVSSILVYSHKFKHRAVKQKDVKNDKVELEATQFNKDFDVYSQVPHDVFYLFTPHLMEKLQILAGKYESIAMNVVGNRVILAFNEPGNNAFDQKISIGKLDYDAEINKVQSDIDDIKNFITLFLNIKNGREY